MQSSGTTALQTNGDDAVTLIANVDSERLRTFTIVNTGTAPGFVSYDNGEHWLYMPAAADATHPAARRDELPDAISAVVLAKRVAGGDDMTGLYADAY